MNVEPLRQLGQRLLALHGSQATFTAALRSVTGSLYAGQPRTVYVGIKGRL